MIKKIKVENVFINDEKEITSKKDGKKYNLCDVSIKSADDCPNYPGKWLKMTMFEYKDEKDPKKNKTASAKAENFKELTLGKEILVDVKEEEWKTEDKSGVNLIFKTLSKKEKEVAEQFLK